VAFCLQHEVRGARGGECLTSSQTKDLVHTFVGGGLVRGGGAVGGGGGHENQ
jgi:hypothetical protein